MNGADTDGLTTILASEEAWRTRNSHYCNASILPTSPYLLTTKSTFPQSIQNAQDKRWLFYPNPSLYDIQPVMEDVVIPFQQFPFNITAVLAVLILFNMLCYLVCNMVPYKIIDPTPKGLKRLLYGSEIKSLTSCCSGNEVIREVRSFKTFTTLASMVDDVSTILGADADSIKREKRRQKENQEELIAEREQQVREGRTAKRLLSQLLKTINRERFILPGVLERKDPPLPSASGKKRSTSKRVLEMQRRESRIKLVKNLEGYAAQQCKTNMWWLEETPEVIKTQALANMVYDGKHAPLEIAQTLAQHQVTTDGKNWKDVLSKLVQGSSEDTLGTLSAHDTTSDPVNTRVHEPVDESTELRAVMGLQRVLASRKLQFDVHGDMMYQGIVGHGGGMVAVADVEGIDGETPPGLPPPEFGAPNDGGGGGEYEYNPHVRSPLIPSLPRAQIPIP